LVGVVLGAVLPPIGTALVASSIGAALLLSGLSMNLSFPLIVVVAVGSFVGQAVVVYRLMPVGRDVNHAEASSEKRPSRQFSETLRWGSAVFAALVLVVIFTAPQHGPGTGPRPDRMERLIQQDQLARSGLVISAGNNLYLSGRAFPVAIASKRPGFLSRILLPVAGRDPSRSIREMRAVKDDEELAKMRRAAAITSQAFADIEPLIRPGVNESEIDAAIIESFRRNGATGIAFGSIVGSGPNAVLPHYEKNDAVMDSGMVVIDIGCSVDGYASDMTRSFPVSGDLTAEQRVLVDTVNAAGDGARAILREGVTMGELDRAAREVIEEAGFGPYFLHRLGHHVGLSVHDPHARELKAGMVITIEPGLYISEGADIDPAYWNQGVRIEDSYIVTENGYEEITFYPR
jgi:methionine aminopeptidase